MNKQKYQHLASDQTQSTSLTHHRSTLLLDLLDHRPIIRTLLIKRTRLLRVSSHPNDRSVTCTITDVGHVVEEGDFEIIGMVPHYTFAKSDC